MNRPVVARYLLAAAVGAGFLLATTAESVAKKYTLECKILPENGGCFALKNTTGRTIRWPSNSVGTFTFCTATNCAGHEDSRGSGRTFGPGETFIWCGAIPPPGTQYCSFTIDQPEMFEEKPKPPIKDYSRTRPPGPPQPGLLETTPGYSPQAPSGLGTPKPSAPPPSAPPSLIIR